MDPEDLKVEPALGTASSPSIAGAEEYVEAHFHDLLEALDENKPGDRSEQDRAYAVTITEVEKAYAYFKFFAPPVDW